MDLLKICPKTKEIVKCKDKIPKKDVLWFNLIKLIDAGHYGKIYLARTHTNKNIIVKIFSQPKKEIEHELCFQHTASIYGIAPDILDYWICGQFENKALIAMNFGGNTNLHYYLKEHVSQIEPKDERLLTKALQIYPIMFTLYYKTLFLNRVLGIYHFDMHLNNILVSVDKDNNFQDLKIIDYGKSESIDDINRQINMDICESKDKFDGITKIYKSLHADVMLPLEFYIEEFIGEGDTKPITKSLNPVFRWFYEDFIFHMRYDKYITIRSGWKIEDLKEHIQELRDGSKIFLEKKIKKLGYTTNILDKALRFPPKIFEKMKKNI